MENSCPGSAPATRATSHSATRLRVAPSQQKFSLSSRAALNWRSRACPERVTGNPEEVEWGSGRDVRIAALLARHQNARLSRFQIELLRYIVFSDFAFRNSRKVPIQHWFWQLVLWSVHLRTMKFLQHPICCEARLLLSLSSRTVTLTAGAAFVTHPW